MLIHFQVYSINYVQELSIESNEYSSSVPSDFQGRKVTTNGEHAAQMFCKVETLLPNVTPFTWLFIRPPWATSGACCKECVFRNMKSYTAKVSRVMSIVC